MRNLCLETKCACFMGGLMLMAFAVVTGCQQPQKPLPEPATTNSLSGAETRLDTLTDRRINRVAAATAVASENANNLPPSIVATAIKGQLEITKAMVGTPNKSDLDYAMSRAYNEALVKADIIAAQELKKRIAEADANYEREKAKKEAEYNAALAERDLKIKEMKADAEIKDKQRNNERLMTWGGAAFGLGLILVAVSPMILLKKIGAALIAGGLLFVSIPFISGESWFKYGMFGIILLTFAGVAYALKQPKPVQCDAVDKDNKGGNDPSTPTSPN